MSVTNDMRLMNFIAYVFITLLALLCLLPFILVISGSLSSQESILNSGYQLFPVEFSFAAYELIFSRPGEVLQAYFMTISATVLGTVMALFITAMTAYAIARKDFAWRNKISFFFYFTMLFSGGLLPWYILVTQYLRLSDTFLVLVLPILLNVFNLLVMKSFMSAIPDAITESGKLEGANDFIIFIRLILPLAKPALAAIGLFIALGYWNDWTMSFFFVQDKDLYSLQFYLYKIVAGAQALARLVSVPGKDLSKLPTETLKLAMTVVATGPIVLLYPYAQQYFVSGLTIGSVKG
jgi:putative aldouronate transport system permease protein